MLLQMAAFAQVVVTSAADDGSLGTLRQTIASATNSEMITFASNLSGSIILLNNPLTINTNLTIDASMLPGGIQINGQDSNGVFDVTSGTTNVVLNRLTITDGNADTNNGGGIYNTGMLTLNQCTLSQNSATYFGGGIYNAGTLTVNQSTLSENMTESLSEVGIYNIGGGCIYNTGTLMVNECTLSGNTSAYYGGCIYNTGTLMVNECTLSGNTSTYYGGCIYNTGTLMVNQTTLSGNTAISFPCGGIYNSGTLMTITNTIVAGNSGISSQSADIDDAGALLIFGGANIIEGLASSAGDNIIGSIPLNASPQLAALGNYGGPTLTMPPLYGSPAIDAANDSATNIFATDQRGYPRLSGEHVDIGAVEVQVATTPPMLESPTQLGNGAFQFSFTNLIGGSFTVFASTNVALPLNEWLDLGTAIENPVGSGYFQFTDSQASNMTRFYYIHSP